MREGAALSCLFLAISCVMFAVARSVFMLYMAALVMGIPYALGALFPLAIFMNSWFEDRRATATAISMCGSSACAILLPPVITFTVESRGLTQALLIEAGFILICTILLYGLLRSRPADMGIRPYREAEGKKKTQCSRRLPDVHLTKWETALFTAAMFTLGLSGAPNTAHYTIHYRTAGYTGIQAATALSVYGLLLAVGKCAYGLAVDRKGTYKVNYTFQAVWIAACFMTAAVNGSSTDMLYLSAALNGIGLTLGSIGITVWSGELTTKKDYVRSVRRCNMVNTFGSLLGAPLPGMIADHTGSYGPAYIMYGLFLGAAFITVQIIYGKYTRLQGKILR